MPDNEYHVASYVVRSRPEHGEEVAHQLNTMNGFEVHAREEGKLVVTAEAESVRELADRAAELEQIEKVIAVAPVYHEFASDGESDNPVSRTQQEKSQEFQR